MAKSNLPIIGEVMDRSTISVFSALWPMAVLPVLFLVTLSDQWLWSGEVKAFLPSTPLAVTGYSLIFGLPHIIGSFFSLADKEYLAHYRTPVTSTAISAALLVVITLAVLPPFLGLLFFNVVTVYHTIGQQVGIARGFLHDVTQAFGAWRYSAIFLACTLPVMMFFPPEQSGELSDQLTWALYTLSVTSSVLSALACWQQKSVSAMAYVAGTQFLLLFCTYFVLNGYFLFAALAPQIIHDITAFNIYIRHDRARLSSQATSVNCLYQLLRVTPRSLAFVLPVMAASIAYLVSHSVLSVVGLWLSYLHYLLEGTLWRRGSLHRQYFGFAR